MRRDTSLTRGLVIFGRVKYPQSDLCRVAVIIITMAGPTDNPET